MIMFKFVQEKGREEAKRKRREKEKNKDYMNFFIKTFDSVNKKYVICILFGKRL